MATPCWPGAGLGDDALLAHAAREQDLPHHVVDLVRAGMVELVALEVDFRAFEMLAHPLGEIERAGAADIMRREMLKLLVEGRIDLGLAVSLLQRQDQRHQRFGDKATAENAEMAPLVRAVAEGIGLVEFGHERLHPGARVGAAAYPSWPACPGHPRRGAQTRLRIGVRRFAAPC